MRKKGGEAKKKEANRLKKKEMEIKQEKKEGWKPTFKIILISMRPLSPVQAAYPFPYQIDE